MMKSGISTALTCAAALVLGSAFSRATNSEPRRQANRQNVAGYQQPAAMQYFLKQPMSLNTGRENLPGGEFWMCVNIFEVQGRKYASLWNVMTYIDRWLVIRSTPLRQRPSGKFAMEFTDGDGNEGVGTIEYLSGHRIRVDIGPTKPSEDPPSRNVLGQYVTKDLPEAACPIVRFLNDLVP